MLISRLIVCSLVLAVRNDLSLRWDVRSLGVHPYTLVLGTVFEVKEGTRVLTNSLNAINYRQQPPTPSLSTSGGQTPKKTPCVLYSLVIFNLCLFVM